MNELIKIFEKYCEEHNDDILPEYHSGREIARRAFWAGVKAAQQQADKIPAENMEAINDIASLIVDLHKSPK